MPLQRLICSCGARAVPRPCAKQLLKSYAKPGMCAHWACQMKETAAAIQGLWLWGNMEAASVRRGPFVGHRWARVIMQRQLRLPQGPTRRRPRGHPIERRAWLQGSARPRGRGCRKGTARAARRDAQFPAEGSAQRGGCAAVIPSTPPRCSRGTHLQQGRELLPGHLQFVVADEEAAITVDAIQDESFICIWEQAGVGWGALMFGKTALLRRARRHAEQCAQPPASLPGRLDWYLDL